jgi:hypothetical protein
MHTQPENPQATIPFDLFTEREKTIEYTCHFQLSLYNHGLPCGPKAIQQRFHDEGISSVPSISTIARILRRQHLTHQRTGYYKGDYS